MKTAIELFAFVYGVSCLYMITQAVRRKLSKAEMIIFAVASLVIPAYFFLGR